MVLAALKKTRGNRSWELSLSAVIDKRGCLSQVQIESLAYSTAPNVVAINEEAIKAVNTWRYKPTILDGEPVEVSTTIDVMIHPR